VHVGFQLVEHIFLDVQMALAADELGALVLGVEGVVLLGVEVDLFAALFVFEAQFVEVGGAAALAAAALQTPTGFFGGQAVGRPVFGVVNAAGDERPVGVALQEIDHNFLTDAWQGQRAVAVASPLLGHADPATAVWSARP
jgi:hypothetical protein